MARPLSLERQFIVVLIMVLHIEGCKVRLDVGEDGGHDTAVEIIEEVQPGEDEERPEGRERTRHKLRKPNTKSRGGSKL